jgi:hypothetical protein
MLVAFVLTCAAFGQGDEFEHEPILYSKTTPRNRVSELQARIEKGEWLPARRDSKALLRSVLEALEVSAESQILVFSKTSQQNARISSFTPRAIYFSGDCYVGWAQGGNIEIAVVDEKLGMVFYVLDPRAAGRTPRFRRDRACLSCHGTGRTERVPGVLVRSVFAGSSGFPFFSRGTLQTTHASPFRERWGGWYVTGTHGDMRHMGNVFARETEGRVELDRDAGANVTSLESRVRLEPYLRETSDIVALMVLEHQVIAQNALVRADFATRRALWRQASLQRALEEPVTQTLQGSGLRIVQAEVERVLGKLLFSKEALLTDRVKGNERFVHAFRRGRRAISTGESLRDLDLRTRLFRYRLSYMIHSVSFDALPEQFRSRVYARLWRILTGEDLSKEFAHLDAEERATILRILRATKKGLPEYWTQERDAASG